MDAFNEYAFLNQVSNAQEQIKKVLALTKEPKLAHNVPHTYQDKYLLSEFLGNAAVASILGCFHFFGISNEKLKTLQEWGKSKQVTLSFDVIEECKFKGSETKVEESKVKKVTKKKSTKKTEYLETTIEEFLWSFEVSHSLKVYCGNDRNSGVVIKSRKTFCEISTSTKKNPRSERKVHDPIELTLNSYLNLLSSDMKPIFKIDRMSDTCITPRRNEPVKATMDFMKELYYWSRKVEIYFTEHMFPMNSENKENISTLLKKEYLHPVLPIFQEKENDMEIDSGEESDNSIILPHSDVEKMINGQNENLAKKLKLVESDFNENSFISTTESIIIIATSHAQTISSFYVQSMRYIEEKMEDQLRSAIGKQVTPKDFTDFMNYHNKRFFKPAYAPKSFCYTIRRPEHYPEGLISIEDSSSEPISTIVNRIEGDHPMSFSINAATEIKFHGDKYAHAWVNYTFSGTSNPSSLKLAARARQFSSFILMIGNITSATSFNPKHAIIVQNKDEIIIPILFETIPTPKAFKDAIESLSPEQQAFAKAFRNMQLESTLFGICIIQIKPQLEKLLSLPPDSLTKEIQLTQDLMDLFMTYQVPSDIISYQGDSPNQTDRINQVKEHVSAMKQSIEVAKQKEVENAEQIHRFENPGAEISRTERFSSFSSRGGRGGRGGSGMKRKRAVHSGFGGHGYTFQDNSFDESFVQESKSDSVQQTSPTVLVEDKQLKKNDCNNMDDSLPLNFTKLPTRLDSNFEKLDLSNSLHSVIVSAGDKWKKTFKKGLLGIFETETLSDTQLSSEKNRAFDLLDALSRSGVLDIDDAEFHVILAANHSFDKTLMDTLIQDNINPIEQLERSMIIIGSTIQEIEPQQLIQEEYIEKVQKSSPHLLTNQ